MGNGESEVWGKPCSGLASHPGGNRSTPSKFMLQKLGKLQPDGQLVSYAELPYLYVVSSDY